MATNGQKERKLRNKELLEKRMEGQTYAELARKLNISRQRIQQILSPPPEIRRYIFNKYNDQCADCGTFTGTSGHIHHRQLEKNGGNYHDIDNLVLLCKPCHRKKHRESFSWGKHRLPPRIISLQCSYCEEKYERLLNSEMQWMLKRNKSGLHFCSKTCHGKWLGKNYGCMKGHGKGGKRKYNYSQVYHLRKAGLSGIKISRELDIPEATVYKILLKNSCPTLQ